MMLKGGFAGGILFVISMLAAAPASAQSAGPTCSASDLARFDRLARAISNWQARSKTALVQPFIFQLRREFCQSANALLGEGVTLARISGATDVAVSAYLDAYVGDPDAETLDAALRTALGAAGMARPVVKRYGLVLVDFAHDPDTLQFGTLSIPAAKRLLVPIGSGPTRYAGLKGTSRVCQGSVQVSALRTVTVRC